MLFSHVWSSIAPTAGEESIAAAQGSNVVTVGSFLGGLVAGIVCSLLVMGIVLGVAKLRKEGKSTTSTGEEEKEKYAFLCVLYSCAYVPSDVSDL